MLRIGTRKVGVKGKSLDIVLPAVWTKNVRIDRGSKVALTILDDNTLLVEAVKSG